MTPYEVTLRFEPGVIEVAEMMTLGGMIYDPEAAPTAARTVYQASYYVGTGKRITGRWDDTPQEAVATLLKHPSMPLKTFIQAKGKLQ